VRKLNEEEEEAWPVTAPRLKYGRGSLADHLAGVVSW